MTEQRRVITQGQHAVSDNPEVVFSTLLGSCVCVCLWDPLARVGGLNHILLAQQKGGADHADREGINAMELLINGLAKIGGRRERLIAKVFGGARMVNGLSDIGAANTGFVSAYLQREGFTIKAQSLGGSTARHLLFWPTTGVVRLKRVQGAVPEEIRTVDKSRGNGLELF